ncbi:MAG: ABC transporter permease [Thermoleophilia bacterium]|nr:ABC transporter permease [Thermoleophilia bacterium]
MIAIRNIARNKRRSLLTALGAAVGIMILSSLTSVSEGLRTQVQDTIQTYGIDLAVQSKGAASPFGSKITSADYEALASTEGIESVSSMVIGAIKTPWNPYFLIMGLAPADAYAERLNILDGTMLKAEKGGILLGQTAGKAAERRVGDRLSLSEQEEYLVTGIYASGSNMLDNAAILDIGDAQRILSRDGFVNLAFVRLEQGVSVDEATERVETRLPGLAVVRSGDFAGQISLIRVVDTSAWAISLIALLGSCIVVMNTLVMAVSERTKEIGILMAIGWSRSRIMRTIVWESLIICFVGGLVGSAIGLVIIWGLQFVHPAGLWLWASVSGVSRVFLISLGISLLLGLVSSLYPAFVSTRLQPAEALRHE